MHGFSVQTGLTKRRTQIPVNRRMGQCWILYNGQKHCALKPSAWLSNCIHAQPLAKWPGRGVCSLPWVSRQRIKRVLVGFAR